MAAATLVSRQRWPPIPSVPPTKARPNLITFALLRHPDRRAIGDRVYHPVLAGVGVGRSPRKPSASRQAHERGY